MVLFYYHGYVKNSISGLFKIEWICAKCTKKPVDFELVFAFLFLPVRRVLFQAFANCVTDNQTIGILKKGKTSLIEIVQVQRQFLQLHECQYLLKFCFFGVPKIVSENFPKKIITSSSPSSSSSSSSLSTTDSIKPASHLIA